MRYYALPSLQRSVLREFAERGNLTLNEVARQLERTYHPVHNAAKALIEKGLIQQCGPHWSKEFHGNHFPTFWLSELGVLTAIADRYFNIHAKTAESLLAEFDLNARNDISIFYETCKHWGTETAQILIPFFAEKKLRDIVKTIDVALAKEEHEEISRITETMKNQFEEFERETKELERTGQISQKGGERNLRHAIMMRINNYDRERLVKLWDYLDQTL
ncbi:MAG TPA: helix-turn-helix domain-containing protein [Nitrososphaerales archaeon]|nr:helix-turn-helix domain-containing protein [Nitrososphaerales archaeon]